MRKFLTIISCYLVALMVLAWLTEKLIDQRLANGSRFYFQADWHDLSNHNAEILFVGNSRTYRHVNPFEVEKRLKKKCEIIASSGQTTHLLWLKFKQYLKGNKCPSEVYLQFDPYFIAEINDLYGLDNFRTTFFRDRVDMTSLENYNGYSDYYRYFPLAAVDFDLVRKILLNDTIPARESYEATHGFLGLYKSWSGKWQHPEITELPSQRISNYLDSFAVFCKNNNVKLYLIYPPQSTPSYKLVTNKHLLEEKWKRLETLTHQSIPFVNLNEEHDYSDSTFFFNHIHLNGKGINQYMEDLLTDQRLFTASRPGTLMNAQSLNAPENVKP